MKIFAALLFLGALNAHADNVDFTQNHRENAQVVRRILSLDANNPADCKTAVPLIAQVKVIKINFADPIDQVGFVAQENGPGGYKDVCGTDCSFFGLVVSDGKNFQSKTADKPVEFKMLSTDPIDDSPTYGAYEPNGETISYPMNLNAYQAIPLKFTDAKNDCEQLTLAQTLVKKYVAAPVAAGASMSGGAAQAPPVEN